MDYVTWSQEYLSDAEKVKEDIEKLKSRLKNTHGDAARTIRANLITLRTMYADCIKTAELLAVRGGVTVAA